MKNIIPFLFFILVTSVMGEKMEILKNGALDLWEGEKPIGWSIKNCQKISREDGYGICFLEKGEISQKLENIKEGKKYRLEFIYQLPDYGVGYIRWKITGVRGDNLTGIYRTPYFHTKPNRVVEYFKVEKIESKPEIVFYGGGRNSRTILDKVIIAPVDGGYTGCYLEKRNENEGICIFSIANNKNKPEKYSYKLELVNYFLEKIYEKKGDIKLNPQEFIKFEVPFRLKNSIRYRAKIEVMDEKGKVKEDVSFIESDDIGNFRKKIRITRDDWKYYLLNKDLTHSTEKQMVSLSHTASTPKESFHRVIRFMDKVDLYKNWYAVYEKDVYIPYFDEGERVFIEIPRAANSPEVYINGNKTGFFEGRVPVFLDITEHVKKNSLNNIRIKVGTWKTGYEFKEEEIILNLPHTGTHQGLQSFNNFINILPPIRVEDVYIRTSFREKKIYIEYTIRNDTQHPEVVSVIPEILDNGKIVKSLKEGKVLVRGENSSKIIFEEKCENPKLWMPRYPYLYRLRTKLYIDDEQIDEHNMRFGFREVWTEGKNVIWNGKNIKLRTRLSFPHPLHAGIPLNLDTQWRALRQYTENGIWFSRSFTIGDPFFIDLCDEMGYVLRHSFELNAAFSDWRQKISKDEKFWNIMEEHVRKLLIENRNHPSILCWSMENETFLCGLGDQQPCTIDKYKKLREVARGIHPKILIEHDGSEPENDAEIINLHYPLNPARTIPYSSVFPPKIFEKDTWYGLQLYPGSLLWDEKKPLVLGEDFIGFPEVPQSLSILNDEEVYDVLDGNPRRGKDYEKFDRAYHKLHRPFMEQVRERELAYLTTWPLTDTGWSDTLKDVLIFIEEPFKNLKSRESIKLNFYICYDDLLDRKCKVFWEYKIDGKSFKKGSFEEKFKTGDVKKFKISLKNPVVKEKKNAAIDIKLISENKIIAERKENYKIFPETNFPSISFVLYDKKGDTEKILKKCGFKFEKKEKPEGKLFVIGKNNITEDTDFKIKDEIIDFVKNGGKVLILGQEGRIKQIFPFEINPNVETYSYAVYPRVSDHPVLKGIEKDELYFWKNKGYYVSRNNYWKPEVGNYLSILDGGTIGGFLTSALMEIYIGNGSIILSQLSIVENLGKDPVAERIFSNILDYSKNEVYRKPDKSVNLIGGKEFVENFRKSGYLNISEKSDVLIVDGKLKDLDIAKDVIRSAENGKTVWIIGIDESSAEIWEKSGLKIKLNKKGTSHIIKKVYDPEIAGLSNTDLFWVGMKLAPLPGEWFSQGTANIIDYECEVAMDNKVELVEKGALVKIPYGKGFILLDNINWYKYINDDALPKARRIFTTIATNLNIKINPDFQLIPENREKLKFYPVDMEEVYNEELNSILKEKCMFDGIPFILKPGEKGVLLLGSENLTQPEPRLKTKVELKINEKFDILYFLLTAYDPYEGGQGYGWGEKYGGCRIFYEDGSFYDFSFLHKVHSVNIFEYMGDLLKAKVVWRGPTPFANWWDMYTRWPGNRWIQREHPNNIYLTKWKNPYPEKKIEKLVFYSTNVHVVPVIIGITGGRYEK